MNQTHLYLSCPHMGARACKCFISLKWHHKHIQAIEECTSYTQVTWVDSIDSGVTIWHPIYWTLSLLIFTSQGSLGCIMMRRYPTLIQKQKERKKNSSASQFKVRVIFQITGIDVQCCTMTFVSSAWSLFIWDWKNRVLIKEYKWLKFDKKKKILSQNIKSHTATGLENWAIGSTFADLYSSPLNSESRSKRNIH